MIYTKKKPCVYIVMDKRSGNIKIGYTSHLQTRLSYLRLHGVKVEVLKVFYGKGFDYETELHQRFADDRINEANDWFRYSENIRRFIDGN